MANGKVSISKTRLDLNATGLRVTNQRAIILDIIRRSESHLDADEIYRRAKNREPRISLSTVYRSLQRFKEIGLVEEHHFDDSHHHYEMKKASTHHHLVCRGCGRVIEFDYDLPQQIAEDILRTTDFDTTSAELRITGYCSKCREEKS